MHSMNMRWVMAVWVSAAFSLACGPEADLGAPEDGDASLEALAGAFKFCARQHIGKTREGEPVVVCDAPHPGAPQLRLPAPVALASGETELYAAFTFIGGGSEPRFVDADGTFYGVLGANDQLLSSLTGGVSGYLPASMRMPTNRALFLLYKVRARVKTVMTGGAPLRALRVKTATPAVSIPGEVLDSQLLGAWEGWVSASLKADETAPGCFGEGVRCFDSRIHVPVRYRFTKLVPTGESLLDFNGAPLPDQPLYRAEGTIENLSGHRKLEDGRCVPSLASLATFHPFRGAKSAAISAMRVNNMHGPGDNEFTFRYPTGFESADGMNPGSLLHTVHPARLIQKSLSGDWDVLAAVPHAPNNGHRFEVRRAAQATAAAPCTNPIQLDFSLPAAGRYLARYAVDPVPPALATSCVAFVKSKGATNVVDYSASAPFAELQLTTAAQRDAIAAKTDCFIELTLQ